MAKIITGKKIIDVDGWDGNYEGELLDGKAHGKGKLSWQMNQNVYEGDFVKDKMTGKGKKTYYNIHGGVRWIYEGGFVNGKEHGNGIEYNSIGQIEQKGKWRNGFFKESILKNIIERIKQKKQPKRKAEDEAYWKAADFSGLLKRDKNDT